ncbi:hypothetical protein [Rubricoccus marinus]|uniref:Uncharacterized protein n=1 Tax=Rubricoccus marinus TaxID=716817 RepID=A0A259TVE4_9BACT|nr:hypothetical protein [Rubricoccus marinus]OZC01670.1 hypothetical protein BSZ36_00940 [Rubricoccus marinus]
MGKLQLAAALAAVGFSPFLASWLYYEFAAEGAASPYARGNAMPFDRGRWHMDYEHSRHFMVDDLLRTHDFRGWTRPQVEALLGEADLTQTGFTIPLGEDYPGRESIPRRYYLDFGADQDGLVTGARFRCAGEC